MSSNKEKIFTKIQGLVKERIEANKKLSFPCKYMVFHQAKKYCHQCGDFICDKCIQKHDKSHNIQMASEIASNLPLKIKLYTDIAKGNYPNEVKEDSDSKIEVNEKIIEDCIYNIDNSIEQMKNIKKKMFGFFELRKKLIKKYNKEESKINDSNDLIKKITQLENEKVKEIDIQKLNDVYNFMKFEKKDTILFKYFITFYNNIENKINEYKSNNKFKSELKEKKICQFMKK